MTRFTISKAERRTTLRYWSLGVKDSPNVQRSAILQSDYHNYRLLRTNVVYVPTQQQESAMMGVLHPDPQT